MDPLTARTSATTTFLKQFSERQQADVHNRESFLILAKWQRFFQYFGIPNTVSLNCSKQCGNKFDIYQQWDIRYLGSFIRFINLLPLAGFRYFIQYLKDKVAFNNLFWLRLIAEITILHDQNCQGEKTLRLLVSVSVEYMNERRGSWDHRTLVFPTLLVSQSSKLCVCVCTRIPWIIGFPGSGLILGKAHIYHSTQAARLNESLLPGNFDLVGKLTCVSTKGMLLRPGRQPASTCSGSGIKNHQIHNICIWCIEEKISPSKGYSWKSSV